MVMGAADQGLVRREGAPGVPDPVVRDRTVRRGEQLLCELGAEFPAATWGSADKPVARVGTHETDEAIVSQGSQAAVSNPPLTPAQNLAFIHRPYPTIWPARMCSACLATDTRVAHRGQLLRGTATRRDRLENTSRGRLAVETSRISRDTRRSQDHWPQLGQSRDCPAADHRGGPAMTP